MFNKKLKERISVLESQKLSLTILQPELIRKNDVLIFRITSEPLLNQSQMESAKTVFIQGLEKLGFENEVIVLNNTDLEIVRSLIV